MMDDVLYAHIYPKTQSLDTPHCLDTNNPIKCWEDVWVSQWNHYLTTNGRGLVHLIVQSFCGMIGKSAFNQVTSIVFLFFSLFLTKTFFKDKRIEIGHIAISLCFFLFLIPEPTCLYDGIAYGVNYLWSSTACLAFVYCLMQKTKNPLLIYMMPLLGFAAGWSHEGIVIGIGVGIAWKILERRFKLEKWETFAIAGFVVGAFLLVFSPANIARAGGMNDSDWAGGAVALRLRAFHFMRGFYAFFAAFLVLLWVDRKSAMVYIRANSFWIVTWVTSLLFIVGVGALNRRAVYGVDLFSVILLFRILPYFGLYKKHERLVVGCTMCVMLFAIMPVLYYQVKAGEQYKNINEQIEQCDEADCLVKVEDVNPPYLIKRYICQYQFDEPWEDWEQRVLTWYNHKNLVIIAEGDCQKVEGKNPFYKLGNYLYTQEPQPETVAMKWHLGDYRVYDIVSLCKKIIGLFVSPKSNEMQVLLPVDRIVFNGKEYYRVGMSPCSSREILAMDIDAYVEE